MTVNTMTYEYYFTLGAAWAKDKDSASDTFAQDLEHHIHKCHAYLKDAFRDGVESLTL